MCQRHLSSIPFSGQGWLALASLLITQVSMHLLIVFVLKQIHFAHPYTGVASWTKKLDVFNHDLLVFPINHNNLHWCLASADLRNSTICYYDSMLGSGLSGTMPHHCLLPDCHTFCLQSVHKGACLSYVLPASMLPALYTLHRGACLPFALPACLGCKTIQCTC